MSAGSTLIVPYGINLDPTAGIFTPTGTIICNGTIVGWNVHTISPGTYTDLTLSGDTVYTTTGVKVNGILTIEGTATLTPSISFGSNATIVYNSSSIDTTGAEWPSTFSGTGGVIIKNTGTIIV